MEPAPLDGAPRRQHWQPPLLVLFLVVFSLYLVGSRLAFALLDSGGLDAVFFAPAGVMVALLVLTPSRRWWIVLTGGGSAEALIDTWFSASHGYRWWEPAGFVVANLFGTAVAARLIVTWRGVPDLARRADLAGFLVAIALGSFFSSGIGSFVVWRGGGTDGWLLVQWWLGDALGAVLAGAAILACVASPDRRRLRTPEGLALLLGVPALAGGLFWISDLPLGFLILIGLVGTAIRFGTRATSLVALCTAFVVLGSITSGDVLIVGIEPDLAQVLFKLQLGAFVVTSLYVAAESFERDQATLDAASQHETVRQLQQALLPPPQMTGEGFSAHGVYEAASDRLGVGGDWYDVVDLPDGRLFLCVGDVVGHGTAAVVAMGQLRFAIDALAGLDLTPGEILDRLDDTANRIDGAPYTTVWAAFYDRRNKQLAYSSAGHPPALLFDRSGVRRLEDGRSVPLGLLTGSPRPTARLTLDGATTIVAYTDGVIERPGESIDRGLERIESAATTATSVEAILAQVRDVTGRDDSVVLRIEILP